MEIKSADILINGINFHYYRTGGEKPPIVLVHGITDDGLCWTPVAEGLRGNYDVIMVDTRGHGRSDAPEDGYSLRNLATDLAGVIQALRLIKPILLGHSLGAITVLMLAGLFPDIPQAILLEDPPPFWNDSGMNPRNEKFTDHLARWIYANKRKTWEDLLNEGRSNVLWSEAELEPWINAKHRYHPDIIGLVHPPDLVSINILKLIGQITCPALFISADPALGAVCGENDLIRLRTCLPNLQVAHVPNAGHNIRRDQFGPYMEIVQQYLHALPAHYK